VIKPKNEQLSIRMSEEQRAWVEAQAAAKDRSCSQIIALIIRDRMLQDRQREEGAR
jgi:hypothetical protein